MKCLLVTGASRGIGRYLCEQLADEYDVVGLARTLPEGFEYRFIQADVTDPEQLSAGIKGLKLRRVYGLINCAGVASMNLFMTTPTGDRSESVRSKRSGYYLHMCCVATSNDPEWRRSHHQLLEYRGEDWPGGGGSVCGVEGCGRGF